MSYRIVMWVICDQFGTPVGKLHQDEQGARFEMGRNNKGVFTNRQLEQAESAGYYIAKVSVGPCE